MWIYYLFTINFYELKQDFRDQIGPMCNVKFMVGLLWRYNCKLSGEDLLIYDILEHLEKYVCLDYRFPILVLKFL
jgi:hypothetical protein